MSAERRIHKFELHKPVVALPLAVGDRVLSVGMQRNTIVLWAARDVDAPETPARRARWFVSLNTGDVAPENGDKFIGTVTSSNGVVWHVFEVPHG